MSTPLPLWKHREEMEEAISEMRDLIALFEREPEATHPVYLVDLRTILRDREEWLRGYVCILTTAVHLPEAEIGKEFKSKLKHIVEGVQMLSKPEAIEY